MAIILLGSVRNELGQNNKKNEMYIFFRNPEYYKHNLVWHNLTSLNAVLSEYPLHWYTTK